MDGVREDLVEALEEGLYLAVGMAVLGLQRARSKARELGRAPVGERLAGVGAALAEPVIEPLRILLERARRGRPSSL